MLAAMIDLETLGTGVNSVFVSIGAVLFDPDARDVDVNEHTCFYRNIEVGSCQELGMTIDAGTFYWWLRQPDETRKSISPVHLRRDRNGKPKDEAFGNFEPIPVRDALKSFAVWYKANIAWNGTVWSHGAPFDISMVAETYRKLGLECPWFFSWARDTRTIFDKAEQRFGRGLKMPDADKRSGGHNSLQDAVAQAQHLQLCNSYLDGRPWINLPEEPIEEVVEI